MDAQDSLPPVRILYREPWSARRWGQTLKCGIGVEAEGSGDYGLTLGDGTKVPVSRR